MKKNWTHGDLRPGDLLFYFNLDENGKRTSVSEAYVIISMTPRSYIDASIGKHAQGHLFIMFALKTNSWSMSKKIYEFWWRDSLSLWEKNVNPYHLEVIRC